MRPFREGGGLTGLPSLYQIEDAFALLMGAPFYMQIDRLLEADTDELGWLVGLVSVRHDMEKAHG
jgi:hypothetical protein